MRKKYYLGIDQGTTGTTAALFDSKWNLAAQGYREHTQIYPKPGWVEQNPLELWEAALGAAKQAIDLAGIEAKDIRCIGLDNQGESCMVWDKASGLPLYNAIIWQDRRTARYCDTLVQEAGDFIRKRTGVLPDAYFSGPKLRWLLDHIPGAREKASRGQLLAGTLDSWLIWKLTHGRVHVTDPSTASRTMLLNIHTGQWDREMLVRLEIPLTILPEIQDSACILGYTDPLDFFGACIPISGSLVDQQAALFGQGCFTPGTLKATYGTGCFMLMNTGDTPVHSSNGLLTTVAWSMNQELTFALDGGIYIAGAAMQWLRDKLRIIDSYAQTEAMAIHAGSNGGCYFVPAFVGLAAPHWDPYARGTIVGITGGTTREQLVRATLESIAYQVKDNLDIMEADSGVAIQQLRVDGGMASNHWLMQFQTDILGIPVEVPPILETSALGAAQMAACTVGEWDYRLGFSYRQAEYRRFEPQMSSDQREELLYHWHRALERAKAWEES